MSQPQSVRLRRFRFSPNLQIEQDSVPASSESHQATIRRAVRASNLASITDDQLEVVQQHLGRHARHFLERLRQDRRIRQATPAGRAPATTSSLPILDCPSGAEAAFRDLRRALLTEQQAIQLRIQQGLDEQHRPQNQVAVLHQQHIQEQNDLLTQQHHSADAVFNSAHSMFDIRARLPEVTIQPSFPLEDSASPSNQDNSTNAARKQHTRRLEQLREPCVVCSDKITIGCEVSSCNHVLCFECMVTWLKQTNTCPHCRNVILKKDLKVIRLRDKDLLEGHQGMGWREESERGRMYGSGRERHCRGRGFELRSVGLSIEKKWFGLEYVDWMGTKSLRDECARSIGKERVSNEWLVFSSFLA